MAIHQDLARGHWQTLSLAEQLGNIGSEVHRAISWKEKNQMIHAERALDRALDLIDLTLSDPRWRMRYKELARAREVVCDFLCGENFYGTTAVSLERYFDAFALLARKSVGS